MKPRKKIRSVSLSEGQLGTDAQAFPHFGVFTRSNSLLVNSIQQSCWLQDNKSFFFSWQCQTSNSKKNEYKIYFTTLYEGKP